MHTGHIEWHLEVGLAVQFIEAPLIAQQRASSLPSSLSTQCAALGLPVSGNAAGHASATDLSGLPLGPFPQNNGWHPRGIGAMLGCVATATLGMATVAWYALGGHISEEEMEDEARERARREAAERLSASPAVLAAVNRLVAACGQMSASVQRPFLTVCDAAMGVSDPSFRGRACVVAC